MITDEDPTKIALFVSPSTFQALTRSSARASISRTDIANRAILLHDLITSAGLWRALFAVVRERATIGRFAAEAGRRAAFAAGLAVTERGP